jgi:hypothetical protein
LQWDTQKIRDHAFTISDRAEAESNSTAAVEGAVNTEISRCRSTFQPQIRRLLHLPAPVLLLLATHLPYPTEETETTGLQDAEGSGTDFSGSASGNTKKKEVAMKQ